MIKFPLQLILSQRVSVKLAAMVFFAMLAISLLAVQIHRQYQRMQEDQKWLTHTLQVQGAAQKFLITVVDGTNAVRGYIITGDQAFLLPYHTMTSDLPRQFDSLVVLMGDNPVQQQNLTSLKLLLEQRLAESALQVRLYQEQGVHVATTQIAKGPSYQINQNIRQQIDTIYDEEQRLFDIRNAALERQSRQAVINNVLIVVLFVILSALLIWSLAREARQRQQQSQERERLNAELDARNMNLEAANIALRQSDRLKNEFLSAMSHELRTPLNSIIGFTGLLRMGIPGPLNDEQHKQLNLVDDSAKHLLHLINDLLDLSRIEAGRASLDLEEFNLDEVVQETFAIVKPMASQKGLSLRAEFGDGDYKINSDRRKVYQVLLNLVNNAVKFSDHGTIIVTCRLLQSEYEISVSDQGIGIRPEQMALLFQAFRQADGSARRVYEGTGLGLYLSKKLLSMLGGNIRAESNYGKGSTFIFTIPLFAKGSE